MMRIRMPNGMTAGLPTACRDHPRAGRNVADLTTRQQVQLRW
jgi:sulfite reductase beta subunit-like hemoprotein